MKLNARQKAFCEFYVACGNATESAKKAGYSEKTARVIGQENLLKPALKSYIQELMARAEEKRIASAEEVLQFLTASLRGEIEEEVVVTEGEGDGCSSARIVKKQIGSKDRIKAAELLGKRHMLFSEKLKVEGSIPVMIVGEEELDD